PIPLNTCYGVGVGVGGGQQHGHSHMMLHHHHHHQNTQNAPPPVTATTSATAIDDEDDDDDEDDHFHHHHHHQSQSFPLKKAVKYRECLKNHAASMGGNATDGCGEFMPSGEDGTMEALTCSACGCHRNFHRKEVEGENPSCETLGFHPPPPPHPHPHHHHHHGGGALIPPPPHHQMIMPYSIGSIPSESDDQEEGGGGGGSGMIIATQTQLVKKRFRTKFTQEQKEKMLIFAEKVGWKIQKQEESVVQQFCQEVGVKRRVLKVWMHNNKHTLAKKN
ncbi:hypothetical protein M569_13018, partial [Genlisea aurea]